MGNSLEQGIGKQSQRLGQRAKRLAFFCAIPMLILVAITVFVFLQAEQRRERDRAIAKLKQIGRFHYDNACPRWLDHAWVRNILGNDFHDRFEYIKYVILMPDRETFDEKTQDGSRRGAGDAELRVVGVLA